MVEETTAGSTPCYVTKLNAVLGMIRADADSAHRRMTLLVEVFNDAEYRDKLRRELGDTMVDDFVVANTLDRYVADLGIAFLDGRLVLEAFPDAADWGKMPMVSMVWEAQRKVAAADPGEPHKPRRTATVAQVEELQSKLEAAEAKAKQLPAIRRQVTELSDELTSLRSRIAELERENEELRRVLSASAMVQV